MYGARFGLDRETALRVAGAFGGEMARQGDTCGAVKGAFMVIGLKQGKSEAGDHEARERTYELANLLAARFKARNNALLCRVLLGHDLSTREGKEAVAEKNSLTRSAPGLFRTRLRYWKRFCGKAESMRGEQTAMSHA